MATVIQPFMPRRYNYNPRGSATTQVTMPGHNPFEQRIVGTNRSITQLAGFGPSGALPGMGHFQSHLNGLGDDTTPQTDDDGSYGAAGSDAANQAAATADVAADTSAANIAATNAAANSAASMAAANAAFNAGAPGSVDTGITYNSSMSTDNGAAAAPTTPGAAAGAGSSGAGINWNQIFTGAITGAGTTSASLINAKYGKKPAGAALATKVAASSMTPWLIGGAVLIGLVAIIAMEKK